ncbi:MAG: ADP-ribosylglycohydrolase family protein [Dehalococcoidia bacterium]|jgi:ADP-ribosyl-[dinitrogen reductase] hydrolase|nr:ADP-ribosylglycohydrolase family protein [Dehalococcoidia bacterium]MDW8008642.1 ADP-ribosylglycohydrolase family protein [Chloroflexota bacterium]
MQTDRLRRFQGCLVGLAVGDALGMPVEGLPRHEIRQRYGVLREMVDGWLPAGSTTDDTAQALALAESLAEVGHFDADDFVVRLLTWFRGNPPDVGVHTRRVLELIDQGVHWREAVERVEMQHAPFTAGNGSLMRCAPIALRYYRDVDAVIGYSHEQSRVTHPNHLARAACAFFNVVLARVLRGEDREAAVGYAMEVLSHSPAELLERVWSVPFKDEDEVGTSGFVLDTLECALWAWWHHDSFYDALVAVVNLGGDADTNGAVAGALVGAHLGLEAVPGLWASRVPDVPRCLELAERLFRLAEAGS